MATGYANPVGRMPVNTAAGSILGASPATGAYLGNNSFSNTPNVIDAVPRYGGKTIAEGGKSPAMLAAEKAEASWQAAMGLLQKQGPYTPEVVTQLTNRRADQTAAAEAVNAEEIRNTAAARGMDPTQALRQAQQQRQASNVAFSGDIASQAAVQNFAAETPGRMAAAQANLGRQFGGGSAPAVTGGGVGGVANRTAFSSGYNPGAVHQQAATMNQTRQPTNLNRPTAAKPVIASTAAANAPAQANQPIYRTPTQQNSLLKTLNSRSSALPFNTPEQADASWSTYK